MLNLKISGIMAGAAFVISLLLGFISRTSVPLILIRALAFAFLFFLIPGIIKSLASRFLPELLTEADSDGAHPGSRVNIREGDDQDYDAEEAPNAGADTGIGMAATAAAPKPVLMGAQADDSEEGLGNISDLLAGGVKPGIPAQEAQTGMDQNAEEGYNSRGMFDSFAGLVSGESPGPDSSAKAPPAGGYAGDDTDFDEMPGSVDILPDLDSMAGAFRQISSGEDSDTIEYSVSTPTRPPPASKSAPAWTGDFNAKEIAAGLRTVLNKEKEG